MMEELETDEICDKCKKPISILVTDFEQIMKDGDLILCPDCEKIMLEEEIETVPKRKFEYMTLSKNERPFADAGQNEWELIAVDGELAYFKREFYFEDIE